MNIQTTTIRMRRPYRMACRPGDEVVFRFVTSGQHHVGLEPGVPYICIDRGYFNRTRKPNLFFTRSFAGSRNHVYAIGIRPIKGQLEIVGHCSFRLSGGVFNV